MGFDEFIYEGPDLIETEFGGGMRIKHGGVIDVFTLAGEGSFDNERLDVDVGLLHGSELRRHYADLGRLKSAFIDEAGNFNTTILWKVINKPVIGDVAIDDAWCASFHGVNDERTIFLTAFVRIHSVRRVRRRLCRLPIQRSGLHNGGCIHQQESRIVQEGQDDFA